MVERTNSAPIHGASDQAPSNADMVEPIGMHPLTWMSIVLGMIGCVVLVAFLCSLINQDPAPVVESRLVPQHITPVPAQGEDVAEDEAVKPHPNETPIATTDQQPAAPTIAIQPKNGPNSTASQSA